MPAVLRPGPDGSQLQALRRGAHRGGVGTRAYFSGSMAPSIRRAGWRTCLMKVADAALLLISRNRSNPWRHRSIEPAPFP